MLPSRSKICSSGGVRIRTFPLDSSLILAIDLWGLLWIEEFYTVSEPKAMEQAQFIGFIGYPFSYKEVIPLQVLLQEINTA